MFMRGGKMMHGANNRVKELLMAISIGSQVNSKYCHDAGDVGVVVDSYCRLDDFMMGMHVANSFAESAVCRSSRSVRSKSDWDTMMYGGLCGLQKLLGR
jgi:hypothetical protein